MVVTCDDDFVLAVDDEDYRAVVVYIHDSTLSVQHVADIVHAVSQHYPQDKLRGLEFVGEDWL